MNFFLTGIGASDDPEGCSNSSLVGTIYIQNPERKKILHGSVKLHKGP
jgi:hypothetical protein